MRGAWKAWLGMTAVAVAALPLLPPVGRELVLDGIGAAVVAAVVVMAMTGRLGRRLPWLLLAGGQAMFVAGDLLWGYYDLVLHQDPFPSPADAFYIAGYPLLALSLWQLLRARSAGGDHGSLLDAFIVTLGAGLVTWVFLIVPLATDPTLGLLGRTVAGAYPVGDLLLLAVLVRLVLTGGVRSPAFRLLGASYAALLVADVAFAVGELTGRDLLAPANAVFVLAYGLAGAAALHPSAGAVVHAVAPTRTSLTMTRLVGLGLASLITPAVVVHQTLSGVVVDGLVIAIALGALVLLVMLRMSGLLRQIERQAAAMAELANLDGLTGIANRRAWEERLPRLLADAARHGTPVAVALLDVDHFKRYNDRHGHLAGDDLLRSSAAAWAAKMRVPDLVARYGGEEFGVVVTGCTGVRAVDVVDRLREQVPHGQTCSAGVAEWDGLESPAALVHRADQALYAAKGSGRDRTVLAGGTPADAAPEATAMPPGRPPARAQLIA